MFAILGDGTKDKEDKNESVNAPSPKQDNSSADGDSKQEPMETDAGEEIEIKEETITEDQDKNKRDERVAPESPPVSPH